jgi:hypothetical protein
MTLPERTLQLLATLDPDRAKAVVRLADAAAGPLRKKVDLVEVAPGRSVILLSRSAYLGRIPWLRLVETAPGRHLVSVTPGTPVEKLEVAISDLLELIPEDEPQERDLLERLLQSIRGPRRNRRITKEEILVVESLDSIAEP